MNTALVFLTNVLSTLAAQTSTFVQQYQNTTVSEVYDMLPDVALRERIVLSTGAFCFALATLLVFQGNIEKPQPYHVSQEKKLKAHPMIRRSMRKREFYYLE